MTISSRLLPDAVAVADVLPPACGLVHRGSPAFRPACRLASKSQWSCATAVCPHTARSSGAVLRRKRRPGPNTFYLERFVPAPDFPARLRIVGTGSHMRHSRDAEELFEVLVAMSCGRSGDDPRPRFLVFLLGRLENDVDGGLRH